jgi:NAD(P)-dependent dehydrogenase (short-subunit alcohol dehydrogenase family)
MSEGSIDGKSVLITGGTSGVGRTTAVHFARNGAKVAIMARGAAEGEAVLREIESAGGQAIFIQGSVAEATACADAVDRTVAAFGRLDIAVNNAGIPHTWAPLAEVDEREFDQVIAVNLKGVFLSMKYEIPAMLRTGGGSIVNISSVAGLVASPNLGIYTASKHGVNGLTKAAAVEYASKGIRVNALCLGLIETPALADWSDELRAEVLAYHPIGRIGKPEEIAQAIQFMACSPGAGFMAGSIVSIDGGVVAQ